MQNSRLQDLWKTLQDQIAARLALDWWWQLYSQWIQGYRLWSLWKLFITFFIPGLFYYYIFLFQKNFFASLAFRINISVILQEVVEQGHLMYLPDPGLNVCIVILHDLQEDMLDLFMIWWFWCWLHFMCSRLRLIWVSMAALPLNVSIQSMGNDDVLLAIKVQWNFLISNGFLASSP